jgi:uncharacterized membrane protein SirB2
MKTRKLRMKLEKIPNTAADIMQMQQKLNQWKTKKELAKFEIVPLPDDTLLFIIGVWVYKETE